MMSEAARRLPAALPAALTTFGRKPLKDVAERWGNYVNRYPLKP